MLFLIVLFLQIQIRIAKNPGTNLGQKKGRLEKETLLGWLVGGSFCDEMLHK